MILLKKLLTLSLFVTTITINAQKPFDVIVKGKGEPVLLFPGFACTGEVWDDTVVELSKNYECHIFTLAGFGTVAPIEKPWLIKIKEGVKEYVKNQKLKNPIIIGHSLGGSLGLWLAIEEENPYSKLILVEALPSIGALFMPNFKREDMRYDSPRNNQMLQMNTVAFESMAEQMANGMTLNEDKKSQIKNWIIQADRETYVYGYTDLLKLDLRNDIAKIKIPVIVLAATHPYGKEMVEKTYKKQYQNLETYDIEYAENAAHFIMYDNPSWFLTQLIKHLK